MRDLTIISYLKKKKDRKIQSSAMTKSMPDIHLGPVPMSGTLATLTYMAYQSARSLARCYCLVCIKFNDRQFINGKHIFENIHTYCQKFK